MAQYLSGVPDLLRQYSGPGGDPYGQAIMTVAMDAVRLGYSSPCPPRLLQDAVIGYLTSYQRTLEISNWWDEALTYATQELKGSIRALEPVPPADSTGVIGYRIADYLDQHGRRTRQDQPCPASLWDALSVYTTTSGDLNRLGDAACRQGLYRHAALLWTQAITTGNPYAAGQLIPLLHRLNPDCARRAAQWAVGHLSLDSPMSDARLLRTLRDAGADDAVTTLANQAVRHAVLDRPLGVANLISELHAVGVGDTITALLARDPARHTSIHNPLGVARLLEALRRIRARDAVTALLARDPASHASLDSPEGVAHLLRALHDAGASDAVAALANRAARHASLDDPFQVANLLGVLYDTHAIIVLANRAASHASLENPSGVARLLRALHDAGASDAVAALLARDPASHTSLDNPEAVSWLLRALHDADADDAMAAVATRAASHIRLDSREAIDELLRALRGVGARDAVAALNSRRANAGMFSICLREPGEALKYKFGREPSGVPSPPWKWKEPITPI